MKFLATATRSIRNAQTGRIKQIIKGEIYTQAFVKPFFTKGATPDFLVDGDLSHFERFVACRPEFFKAQGVESDIYYAVCKAIVAFHGGDTKALRKFAKFGGTVQMAMKLERQYAELLSIEYVSCPHEANDPLAHAERTFPGFYPCSKNQEDVIVDLALVELNTRY
jgi:hypothetical protein